MAIAGRTDGNFRLLLPGESLEFTGERMTTAIQGQIEFEHFHRYCLARDLCAGRDVLDVASGEGYGSAILAGVARSVIGVEIDEKSVAHAREAYHLDKLRFLQGNATELPLEDASVDAVVSFETLEHIREHECFAAEVKRVLRPGGTLVISTPDRAVYAARAEYFNEFHLLELSETQFGSFLSAHFCHVVILHQRALLGSLIAVPESASSWRSYERRAPQFIEASSGLARAPYLIAVASDAELPLVASSVYIDRRSAAEAAEALHLAPAAQAQAAERERERDAARTALEDSIRQKSVLSERHVAQLARLRRSDYDGRLPAPLTRLRRLVSPRRKTLRRLAWEYQVVASSPLFDPAWYLANNSDVAAAKMDPVLHYLSQGASEGRAPGPNFDGRAYLDANPDVAAARQNPLIHYLSRGCKEERKLSQ
jgi:SAM-dependent methyltransferase